MFAFGYYLARYIDWCDAQVKRLKLWQAIAIEMLAVVLIFLVVENAPGWLAALVFVILVPSLWVFGFVAHRHFKQVYVKKRTAEKQLRKNQNMLKGFRK
ncbi:hypothetical protein GFB49_18355 [Epibacterium sp. SM1979]|uniref:Uncharacterized protein n=1 Tax=Tritonibacter litoralis TaxID=2662264 RepID=A0A843YMH2_9RHOB|nr:hypothetical protein [Tritonibacter litoralis]MQQ10432.1 hypothetical protein [Tritonibacter litoralis]